MRGTNIKVSDHVGNALELVKAANLWRHNTDMYHTTQTFYQFSTLLERISSPLFCLYGVAALMNCVHSACRPCSFLSRLPLLSLTLTFSC